MEIIVTRKIIKFNSDIQRMSPEAGPASIKKAYTQVQKLLDQLRQLDGDHPGYLLAWNLLMHYGKVELQDVQLYYTYTKSKVPHPMAKLNHEKAFARLKELIDTAVGVLPRN